MSMTNRERILATMRKERADRIPFYEYWRHVSIGWEELEARKRGMGIIYHNLPILTSRRPHVEVVTRSEATTKGATIVKEYHTPVGTVTQKIGTLPGCGSYIWEYGYKGIRPWVVEYMVKKPEDYEVVKFMVEDTKYEPYFEAVQRADKWVGDEGIIVANLTGCPFESAMGYPGINRFYVDFLRNRDKIMELMAAIERSQEQLYEIAAHAPVQALSIGGSADTDLISPAFFEKFFMAQYDKWGRILHEADKYMMSHMHGKVKRLAHLIAKTPFDIIEALHPPPLGDLPIHEALKLWEDKVIWMAFPESVYVMGPRAVRKYLLNLLRSVIPGDRLVIAASSEHMVPDNCLLPVADIMEKAKLPLSEETIRKIQRSPRGRIH